MLVGNFIVTSNVPSKNLLSERRMEGRVSSKKRSARKIWKK